jgi:eukaryotic-like serine/threonine-protein kinase
MDPARWERVQELFHRAADLRDIERAQFVNGACGEDHELLIEVQRMLDYDGRESLLDRDVVEFAGSVSDGALSSSFEEFSPYRLLRVLGEGGMGVVYLAERKDLGNRVAIKILRDGWLSPARRERFTAEQRTLAQFNHPASPGSMTPAHCRTGLRGSSWSTSMAYRSRNIATVTAARWRIVCD